MKKIRALCLVLCLCMALLPLQALAQNDTAPAVGCHGVDAMQTMPNYGGFQLEASAGLLYDAGTDTMVYMQAPDQRVYPTGLTAILTTLVALEKGNLTDIVEVNYAIIEQTPYDATTANLKAGEAISLRDLLYCIMLNSAVDAALTVADYIAGSVDAFVGMMNAKAQELGCTASRFANPTGMQDIDHYTTARDMLRITLAAMDNEDFAAIYSAVTYDIPATNKSDERHLITTNYMTNGNMSGIYMDSRVVGSKTGYTSDAGRCLMVTAESNDLTYVGLVFGCKTVYDEETQSITAFGHFAQMCRMLDYGFANFKSTCVVSSSMIVGHYPVRNSKNHVSVVTTGDIFSVLPKDATYDRIRLDSTVGDALTAPVAQGDVVGSLGIWYENLCLGQVDLVAATPVAYYVPPQVDQIQQEQEHNQRTLQALGIAVVVLLVILGLVFAFLLVQYVRSAARRAARDARRKRRQRNRTRRR